MSHVAVSTLLDAITLKNVVRQQAQEALENARNNDEYRLIQRDAKEFSDDVDATVREVLMN